MCAHSNIRQNSQLNGGGRYAVEVEVFVNPYVKIINHTYDTVTLFSVSIIKFCKSIVGTTI